MAISPLLLYGIGAGAQAIGSAVGAGMTRKQQKREIEARKAEAELAYQRQVEFWHMQNAYNSPEEQMKRFTAAGLNPHLIYGQGTPGNATSMAEYRPPEINYRDSAAQSPFSAVMMSIIPSLMQVGSWMQNMRLQESEIQSRSASASLASVREQQARQLIDYLSERHPQLLKEAQNKLSLFPYQKSMMSYNTQRIGTQLHALDQEYRLRFGDDLYRHLPRYMDFGSPGTAERDVPLGGTARLEYVRKLAEAQLKEAQASWTDFNITNPQALMQLVLQGVIGIAGQQLRLSTIRRQRPYNYHSYKR